MKALLKHLLAVAALLLSVYSAQAQVKIGNNPTTINGGSLLELESTNRGLLLPRINLTNTSTWGLAGTPAAGMLVYNTNPAITSTTATCPTLPNKIGQYYWDGSCWVALAPATKSTSITTFQQSQGKQVWVQYGSTVSTCVATAGGPPPACADDLNQNGTFTITNSTNDVIFDLTEFYTLYGNNGSISFNVVVYVDKTTAGVFEPIGSYTVGSIGTTCTGASFGAKFTLKNLPVRTYNAKVYVVGRTNTGSTGSVGFGVASGSGCGANSTAGNNLIISVSQ